MNISAIGANRMAYQTRFRGNQSTSGSDNPFHLVSTQQGKGFWHNVDHVLGLILADPPSDLEFFKYDVPESFPEAGEWQEFKDIRTLISAYDPDMSKTIPALQTGVQRIFEKLQSYQGQPESQVRNKANAYLQLLIKLNSRSKHEPNKALQAAMEAVLADFREKVRHAFPAS